MVGEGGAPLSELQAAVRMFQARGDRRVDPKGLRSVIDALEGEFAAEVRNAQKSGDHLVGGSITAASWIAGPAACRCLLRPTGFVSASSCNRCPRWRRP